MTRDDIIRMAREAGWTEYSLLHAVELQRLETFAALVAAAEQRPISDVTEAVTKTVIEVEKLLYEKIGRQWQPSGMSIQTLVDELAALVAEREREACAKVCEGLRPSKPEYDQRFNDGCTLSANAIRARGEV